MRAEALLLALGVVPLPAQTGSAWFAYDDKAPLQYSESRVSERGGVLIFDARFASPRGGFVTCYVVAPKHKDRKAGIVWQHGGGQDRQWFLPDAVELAKVGAVSVLLDGPSERPEALRAKPDPDPFTNQRNEMIQVAVDIRRAADLLAGRGDVDPERMAFAGLSFGSMMGASLTTTEPRFKAYVLMAGLEGFARHYKESPHPAITAMRARLGPENLEKLVRAMAPIDNRNFIGSATAPLLFQAARFDVGVPAEHTYDWFAMAGSAKKELRWYDSGHMLNSREATADRLAWLKKQLKLI